MTGSTTGLTELRNINAELYVLREIALAERLPRMIYDRTSGELPTVYRGIKPMGNSV
jgi:hypothetical protein